MKRKREKGSPYRDKAQSSKPKVRNYKTPSRSRIEMDREEIERGEST
ncbi:Protein of unknown function [Pyronema omphalodes CBS 100304]|uniref:Uncharacterized protein n=1 Tax=Pyronema omphalodes (strain CBS 100304) TaxID=1076935 RepID=U4LLD8_PYROM|nr:Protein of unknown function [Pyronema omphalodes CBS 100304]